MTDESTSPLSPEDTTRLIEFARACKAAARAVSLYPAAHPAIAATLARIVQVTSAEALPSSMSLSVLPATLLLDGQPPARPDAAAGELAALLHSHLIIEMTVRPGGDANAWRQFLGLLGQPPDSLRADGGIARVWATMALGHIDLREIDYTEVLRERAGGESATWQTLVAACLQGRLLDLDEEAVHALLGLAAHAEKLGAFLSALEAQGDTRSGLAVRGEALAVRAASIAAVLRRIVDAVTTADPDRLHPVLQNAAVAIGQLSPDIMMALLSARAATGAGPDVMDAVISQMSDRTVSHFVARNVITEGGATSRLAQAFQTLVRDDDQRLRTLALAREDLVASPPKSPEWAPDAFDTAWDNVAQTLLTSYSDEPYVTKEYGRELDNARGHAVDVERTGDDPPDRIAAWLDTVATSALRALDLTLLLDLLRLEPNDTRWGELMPPVIALLDDLLLVGDLDAAEQLLAVIVRTMAPGEVEERRQQATIAVDVLVSSSMLRHVITHLATFDDAQFERVKTMCVSLGEVLVRPLAEALSVEDGGNTRQRLTDILLAFGNVGRRAIERLKTSTNPAVRRTAIHLMRQFGGAEALPNLTELLDDNESRVQREAVRAILDIGTDAAYRVLQQALTSGSAHTRDAIMQSLIGMRDERATPLFAYILRHIDHRGPLALVYVRAIEGLGTLRDPEGVQPLKEALYKGEWWAPRRTRELRAAAAAALTRVGTPDAHAALEEAARARSRGVRSAARACLGGAPNRHAPGTGAP